MTDTADLIILRDNPTILAIENQMGIRGIEWSPAFDADCDRASIALFGITAADTVRTEPHPDQFQSASRHHFGQDQFVTYAKALEDWMQWTADTEVPNPKDLALWELSEFWEDAGFDVFLETGEPLRCLHRFARQMLAAALELTPTARLTMDGSGAAATSAEMWGKALAADAARFKARCNNRA